MVRSRVTHILVIVLMNFPSFAAGSTSDSTVHAGFRGSRIDNYSPQYCGYVAGAMAGKLNRVSQPSCVWIVSFYGDAGNIYIQFPSGGKSFPYMSFGASDFNESYLNYFDEHGVQTWLQVEPGAASVDTLIDLVLARYRHHPCVIGFGIDVEWLDAQSYTGGRAVTDTEAVRWEQRVRSFDTTYTLFLKHYAARWMPPTYRGRLIFIDDSQGFSGLQGFVNEFAAWGARFPTNVVGFQFGYPADKSWWAGYADPPATLGNALLARIPNSQGLFWVDFSLTQVFPPLSVAENFGFLPQNPILRQNYPNPFNPGTTIRYDLQTSSPVTLFVYDALGNVVATLVDGHQDPGQYDVQFDGSGLASGVYFYRLRAGSYVATRKLLLLH